MMHKEVVIFILSLEMNTLKSSFQHLNNPPNYLQISMDAEAWLGAQLGQFCVSLFQIKFDVTRRHIHIPKYTSIYL